jgi:hypothetical protein
MTVRRMKTYTGSTGYVYQYYFVGKRDALRSEPLAPATEFIFDVSPDRKMTYAVSVFFQPSALTAWSGARGRALSETEQYAAAKMRLFQAFDELDDVLQQGRRLVVDEENILDLLSSLGLE